MRRLLEKKEKQEWSISSMNSLMISCHCRSRRFHYSQVVLLGLGTHENNLAFAAACEDEQNSWFHLNAWCPQWFINVCFPLSEKNLPQKSDSQNFRLENKIHDQSGKFETIYIQNGFQSREGYQPRTKSEKTLSAPRVAYACSLEIN
jgi:hypothetical protein